MILVEILAEVLMEVIFWAVSALFSGRRGNRERPSLGRAREAVKKRREDRREDP